MLLVMTKDLTLIVKDKLIIPISFLFTIIRAIHIYHLLQINISIFQLETPIHLLTIVNYNQLTFYKFLNKSSSLSCISSSINSLYFNASR